MSAYDQTKGELCDQCGWAMKFPGEPCRCELERENAALRDSIDHAETLLCNSVPMLHCSQSEWDDVISKWRDQKHAIDAARARKKA